MTLFMQVALLVVYVVGALVTLARLLDDVDYVEAGPTVYDTIFETSVAVLVWPCTLATIGYVALCDRLDKKDWY